MIDTKPMPGAPKVFISSTDADLMEYREKAKAAAIRAGLLSIMNEDWGAKDAPPLNECMARVDGTYLTVAIVAHHYGWEPEDQPTHKSITWLECERTVEEPTPKQLLVFLADEDAPWPDERKEAYRLAEAALQGKYDLIPDLAQEVPRNTEALQKFKLWLTQNRIRATFATPEQLERKVESALKDWLSTNPSFATQAQALAKTQANPESYLGFWYEFCAYIEIRGLHVGSGRAHRFPIEDLYIELDTAGGGKLKNTLAHTRRVVVGDPGSGKTNFLRWIAHTLAGDRLGVSDNAEWELLGLARPLIPVLVSIAEWLEYIFTVRDQKNGPPTAKDPQWLVHFLAAQSDSLEWGLAAAWFSERLNPGDCLLIFDGLDEAPDRKAREFATDLLEAVAATWKPCPILVTSRPSGNEDRAVLPNFEPSHIEQLGKTAQAMPGWIQKGLEKGRDGALESIHRESEPDPKDKAERVEVARAYELERTQEVELSEGTVIWQERLLVVYSPAHARQQKEGLEQRLRSARQEIEALTPPAGRGKRQITEEVRLTAAITGILKKYRVEGLQVEHEVERESQTRYVGKGRGSAQRERQVIEKIRCQIQAVRRDVEAILAVWQGFGWKAFATNAAQAALSLSEAVLGYRNEFRIERIFGSSEEFVGKR